MSHNILFLSSTANGYTATSHLEHIGSIKQHSRHNIYYHNFVYDIDPDFDFTPFDVIAIGHNFWPEILSAEQRLAIRNARAVKIQFLQDEYQFVRTINGYLEEMGINVMFTCVAEEDFESFYPKSIMNSLMEVQQNLTGYVSDSLAHPRNFKTGRRSVDIGYRSRVSPFFLGKLGHEKLEICEKFSAIADQEGFSHNISVREEDRIYGHEWIKFLQSTRVQLGTPSGASVVDMDGQIVEAELNFRRENPHAGFNEFFEKHLKEHEGKLGIDTISPRVFEYAATGATMVMHEGYYGGHLEKDVHYISVKKDYSNITDVVERIADQAHCREIATNARQHLILDGNYSYQRFVEKFDDVVDRHAPKNTLVKTVDEISFNRSLEEKHEQALFFDKKGWAFSNTPTGKALKTRFNKAGRLRHIPIVGKTLKRIGGDPIIKLEELSLGATLAWRVPEFKKLMHLWLRHRKQMPDITWDQLLKEIVVFGLIKSSQSGLVYAQTPFHTKVPLVQSDGFLDIVSTQSEAGQVCQLSETIDSTVPHPPDFWLGITEQIREKSINQLRWDVSAVFPILQFGVCTVFTYVAQNSSIQMRSASDQYFYFPAFDRLMKLDTESAVFALRMALSAAYGPDQPALVKSFEVT